MSIKRLTRKTAVHYQQLGQFDEHLVTLYSVAFGMPYIYNNTFLLYHDQSSNILYLSLFELTNHSDPIHCIETATKLFQPERIVFAGKGSRCGCRRRTERAADSRSPIRGQANRLFRSTKLEGCNWEIVELELLLALNQEAGARLGEDQSRLHAG